MELLYHYLWQHQLFEEPSLHTTEGTPVQVLHTGSYNRDAGADFLGAKLRIGKELWVGDVEIHLRSSDWYAHGHHQDKAYNTTILHVVKEANQAIATAAGAVVPQVIVTPPSSVRTRYTELTACTTTPPCGTAWQALDKLSWHAWIDRLMVERIEAKMQRILYYLERTEGDWERTFFVALARNFGFGINGEAFEQWALALRPSDLAKHRDDPALIEAFFMGMAGLLNDDMVEANFRDATYQQLHRDFHFLRQKFHLSPISPSVWKFLRLRPQNFPHIRLSQFAHLYCSQGLSLSQLLSATSLQEVHQLLSTSPTPYWQEHYTFGRPAATIRRWLHRSSLDRLVINTVVPFLFTYGRTHAREELCERAISFLTTTPPENDRIARSWQALGCSLDNAAHTQALHHLSSDYCTAKRCTLCAIGRRWLLTK